MRIFELLNENFSYNGNNFRTISDALRSINKDLSPVHITYNSFDKCFRVASANGVKKLTYDDKNWEELIKLVKNAKKELEKGKE